MDSDGDSDGCPHLIKHDSGSDSDADAGLKSKSNFKEVTPQRKRRKCLCLNCGELGHSKKNCPLQDVSDKDRVRIEEVIRLRQAEIKEKTRIRRAEYRQTPENKQKSREYERSPHRKELRKQYRDSEEYKAKEKERNEKRKSTKELLRLRADNAITNPQYPELLATEEELARIDAEYDFSKYKRKDKDVFLDACPRMSYDYTTNNCCVVCDCDWPKALTRFYSLDDAFLPKLRARVPLTEEKKKVIPADVQEDYCLAKYDKRLAGMILSRYGLYTAAFKPINLESTEPVEDLRLCLCNECGDDILKGRSSASVHVASTIAPVDASALPSAGQKRSRKQKERKECTLSDAENGHSSGSDDEVVPTAVANVDDVTGSAGSYTASVCTLANSDLLSLTSSGTVVDAGVATLSLSVQCTSNDNVAVTVANSVPPAMGVDEIDAVIVPNARAEAEAALSAAPSAHATLKPPMNAIANGNWIGYLPPMFWSISRTEEQAVALIHVTLTQISTNIN